jgi:hypothetical protein
MAETEKSVRLSHAEMVYLCVAGFLEAQQIEILNKAARSGAPKVTLQFTREAALEFSDVLTVRLAAVGFDENYEPTPEGHLLEDLIDRFFVD